MNSFPWQCTMLIFLMLVGIQCKSAQYDFVQADERLQWQQKIKQGKIGFYDSEKRVLANIDQPPKVKGEKTLRDVVAITQPCLEYLSKHAKKTAEQKLEVSERGKIEFLVNNKGQASNFFY